MKNSPPRLRYAGLAGALALTADADIFTPWNAAAHGMASAAWRGLAARGLASQRVEGPLETSRHGAGGSGDQREREMMSGVDSGASDVDAEARTGRDRRAERALLDRYWIANMRIVASLVLVWAAVSLGCGVLAADVLNAYRLPGTGYPLGFWFAQQGSILAFVLLVLLYCVLMNRLDARYHRARQALRQTKGPP